MLAIFLSSLAELVVTRLTLTRARTGRICAGMASMVE